VETEDLGVSILHDLHQQRQSLLHAHDTVRNCLFKDHLFVFSCHFFLKTFAAPILCNLLKEYH
jgi:hypothetical protein